LSFTYKKKKKIRPAYTGLLRFTFGRGLVLLRVATLKASSELCSAAIAVASTLLCDLPSAFASVEECPLGTTIFVIAAAGSSCSNRGLRRAFLAACSGSKQSLNLCCINHLTLTPIFTPILQFSTTATECFLLPQWSIFPMAFHKPRPKKSSWLCVRPWLLKPGYLRLFSARGARVGEQQVRSARQVHPSSYRCLFARDSPAPAARKSTW
jgi:hypothetical protein